LDREAPLVIAGTEIAPGERRRLQIPVGRRTSGNEISLPVEVIRGRRPGPRLFLCAAIHGDEIAGVEVIRRVLTQRSVARLRGTLIAVPIVNVYGFVGLTRYLPDRRDLNRSFPGSPRGSLASRLAHIFLNEVVGNATHGIDLHTAAVHRSNLPQIRACLDDPETERLARAFGVPVILNANLRDGSLRQEVLERKIPMLLYEGGEALRFDEGTIQTGVRGVMRVMRSIGMLPPAPSQKSGVRPFIAKSNQWVRAPGSGILRGRAKLGASVQAGDRLGTIADPLGADEQHVLADRAGIVIGRSELPLVNEGDAVFNLATFDAQARVEVSLESFREGLNDPLVDPA
jgi:predicted deacylase